MAENSELENAQNSGGGKKRRNPWSWVPTLYLAEGIPYIIVMSVSVTMYKRMGISNADIALYTSWLYLPWVIKPLWSPLVDIFKTKRYWITIMQLIVGSGMAGVALTLPLPGFFQYTLAFLWLLAFSSATHDIAADGFYMLGLNKHDQAFFVGIRSTFYRFAMLAGQGLLVILAGYLETVTGLPSVDINVKSEPDKKIEHTFQPKKIQVEPQKGDIHIVAEPDQLVMGTKNISNKKADSLKNQVREWNVSHNFYEVEKEMTAEEKEKAEQAKGWWTKNVSEPFNGFIKRTFGPEREIAEVTQESGNIGLIRFHLSNAPETDDEVIVNFGRVKGDKSFNLVEGEQFKFTKDNWDKPAYALVKLDPKLETASVGNFEARAGNVPLAWSLTFFFLAALFVTFFVYHKFILPYPATDRAVAKESGVNRIKEFLNTFGAFFKKKRIGIVLAVLLLYRLGEAQIVKMETPFLLDAREAGGLALTTGDVGLAYGTIGMIALTLGGILGGVLASRNGLKYWIWWMLVAMNLPNLVYVYLSYAMPESFVTITSAIAVEQFGYGFGFTAYMLYMIYVSEGEHKTSHFAICTGFMALGMMFPGMMSGWLQELIGYQHFFIWVVLCTIPIFIIMAFVRIDPEFGTKKSNTTPTETEEENPT